LNGCGWLWLRDHLARQVKRLPTHSGELGWEFTAGVGVECG